MPTWDSWRFCSQITLEILPHGQRQTSWQATVHEVRGWTRPMTNNITPSTFLHYSRSYEHLWVRGLGTALVWLPGFPLGPRELLFVAWILFSWITRQLAYLPDAARNLLLDETFPDLTTSKFLPPLLSSMPSISLSLPHSAPSAFPSHLAPSLCKHTFGMILQPSRI